jgi:hypothetical protein
MKAWGPILAAALLSLAVSAAPGRAQEGRCAGSDELELCCDAAYPGQQSPCRLTLTAAGRPLAGAEITALYRPNTRVEDDVPIGVTDEAGRLEWVPQAAGIVTLRAATPAGEGCDLTVSVRFRGVPTLGLVVMLGAGMLLFGGNAYSFARTFGRS